MMMTMIKKKKRGDDDYVIHQNHFLFSVASLKCTWGWVHQRAQKRFDDTQMCEMCERWEAGMPAKLLLLSSKISKRLNEPSCRENEEVERIR